MKRPCVYMLASGKNGTLYLGVTSDLSGRLEEHENRLSPKSFTARYGVTRLVWWEPFDTMADAITREKTMKGWPRAWKLNVIEADNPDWLDMCPETGALYR